jgi:hypothetical protein
MTVLRNLVTSGLPYTGIRRNFALGNLTSTGHRRISGLSVWLSIGRSRYAFGRLAPVLRAALLAALDADGIEGAADDVIAHARQVLHAAAADEHQRVLLEVVTDTRDVGRDLDLVGQPDARHLAGAPSSASSGSA